MLNILKAVGSAVLQPATQTTVGRCNTLMTSLFHTLCFKQTSPSLLVPQSVITTQIAGLKVKGIVKLRCKSCRRYIANQRMHIYCMAYPKHNQMSIVKKHYNRWHLTSVSTGKFRPY